MRPAGQLRLQAMARQALSEIGSVLDRIADEAADRVCNEFGHALYQPLYGPAANMPVWLNGLGRLIGAFHLQNTDFQSDSHWGWPYRRGLFDVAAFATQVRAAGLEDVPAFLEIIYPFELSDEQVLANITSSVMHCREHYCGENLHKAQIA